MPTPEPDALGATRTPGAGGTFRLAALCLVGVLVRLACLLLAGELEFQSDEANYVYLATTWEYFGFYSDSYRYLWPPGYPFVLRLFLRAFEAEGIFYLKLFQVFASASIGWFTMALARTLFGLRAATLAGSVWCIYLPLIGFTHFLWTETLFLALFLPGLYLLLLTFRDEDRAHDNRRMVVAGVLFGLSLYLKEVHLYLVPVLALVLTVLGPGRSLRRGSLFFLSVVVVVAPWTLRNYEVYGRFLPIGSSLGENCYLGLNAPYKNFDTSPFARHRLDRELPRPRTWFVEVDHEDEWQRAEALTHTGTKLSEGVHRGLGFARAHPGWFLRSRIKKVADFAVPLSFFVRHQGLERYGDSPLGRLPLRRGLSVASVLLSALAMLLGLAGLWSSVEDRASRWFLSTVVLYFLATAGIVAMSRFRIPIMPLAIALGAGWLTGARQGESVARRPRALIAAGALLGFLWWIDYPELAGVFGMAWEPSV